MDKVARLMVLVEEELLWASRKFPNCFNSSHEGYAVILEELDELWAAIMNNKRSTPVERAEEALQVAAMALRYIYDLTDAQQFEKLIEAQEQKGR